MPGVGVIHNLLSFLNKCVHKKFASLMSPTTSPVAQVTKLKIKKAK